MFVEEVAMNSSSPPSVQYLISDLYDELGIPHFQRGLVWNNENMSLLLESLYFDTPCGTIILWEPNEPGQYGIPLSASDKLRYLVIDGQQRIRSLRDVLGPKNGRSAQNTSDEEGGDEEPSAERVWCLNLSRVPELADFFDASVYPMFRLIENPIKKEALSPHNFVPLYLFLEDRDGNNDKYVRTLIKPKDTNKDADVVQKMLEIDLKGRICRLRERRVFFLKILTESSEKNENHLADVVALYNRINSAGKRVEAEEKAFATLVSLYPPTNERLEKLFRDVHPRSEYPQMRVDGLERDDVLKRRKERNFGFKLFIRTFIQVCAYRFSYSPGSNTFSFDVVNSLPFQMRFRNDAKEAQRLFDCTGEVIRFVRWDILCNGLYCDDLQTLPDTMSLLPLFQLLIRFPKLMESGRKERYTPVLQCLALRLLLSKNQTQEEIFELVNLVNRSATANICLKNLHEKIHPRPTDLHHDLRGRFKGSNTLMDRYVLMLYWLLRKNGARDFSYKKNLGDDKPLRAQHEKELQEDVKPEKQHIVPYSLLQKLYNIEKRGRVSRHPVNNIGNITYISHELNHYETGLGSNPIKLGEEPSDNREHHFLGDGEVGKSYDEATGKMAKEAFEKFCEHRRDLIAQAFGEWVKRLAPEFTISEEVKPAPRVDPLLWDRVRRLECSDNIENALLEMISSGPLEFKTWRPKKASVAKWNAAARISSPSDEGFIIRFFDDRLEIEPADGSALYKRFEELMDGKVSPKEQGKKLGNWVLHAQGENTSDILIEFGRRLSASEYPVLG